MKSVKPTKFGGQAGLALTIGALLTGCGGSSTISESLQENVTVAPMSNTVQLSSGIVVGGERDSAGVISFKGIPYAAAPVGERRWRAPEQPASWTGNREAKEYGARCWESAARGGPVQAAGHSEDCLFLNVWTAAKSSTEKRPVMVWVHGGGFQFGAGEEGNGINLARKDVVVVSFNYRLGVFGFLARPDLDTESNGNSSGMFGLLDQVAALEWVKKNIASFGGDPNNVTVFGESAGSHAIGLLMASPKAAGLFHKAIGQSGAFWESEHGPMPSHATALQKGVDLGGKLNANSAADLRKVPALQLQTEANWTFATDPGLTHFGPSVDGSFMPDDPYRRYASGRHNDVPLLIGWNAGEGVVFANRGLPADSVQNYVAAATKVFGQDRLAQFLQYYPANTVEQAKASSQLLIGDMVISQQTWAWAANHQRTGKSPVYTYFYKPNTPFNPLAAHASEIQYVFNNLAPSNGVTPTNEDLQLANIMSSYWVNFARTGNPNGAGLPSWPRYAGPGTTTMGLGNSVQAEPEAGTGRFQFIDSMRINGSLGIRFD